MPRVPRMRRLLGRRAGPIGIALTVFDIWRRIPPAQRRQLLEQTRKHGPKVAKKIADRRRRKRT